MKRRAFIAGLGAAAAWPLAAWAQRTAQFRRVGALSGWSASDPEARADRAVLRSELERLGWIEGRNLQVDFRYGEGDASHMRYLAVELVQLAPDVLFTVSLAATRAVRQQTRTIPIVVAGAGPLGSDVLGGNDARPEGNVTGFANNITSLKGKWLELLKEVAPHVTRIGYVRGGGPVRAQLGGAVAENPANVAAARAAGVDWIDMPFQTPSDLEQAADSFSAEPNVGLMVNMGVTTLREEILLTVPLALQAAADEVIE